MLNLEIPKKYHFFLRIGTCSWKYESWKGLVYDKQKPYRANEYLSDYARYLNTVEIDQWFWSLFPGSIKLPDIATVMKYAQSVPDDFIFTIKAPNSLTLTHFYSRQPPRYAKYAGQPNESFFNNDILEEFLDRLSPLGKKIGPIMFQFEYLNKKKMLSLTAFLEHFQKFIEKAPQEFQYAIETRNPNYLTPAFFNFLKQKNIGFVYLEGYYMPHIFEIFEKFKPRTTEFSIIRLHGGDRKEIEDKTGGLWDQIVEPRPDGLKAAAEIVKENVRHRIKTYVNINNHYEGSAPITIERFKDTLIQMD